MAYIQGSITATFVFSALFATDGKEVGTTMQASTDVTDGHAVPATTPGPPDAHDRDLECRVRNYVYGHQMPKLRQVEVVACNGAVALHGRLASFYEKQLCLNCAGRVAGVIRLIDDLEVSADPRDF
jgi:osmotically-inducible protein OsmY